MQFPISLGQSEDLSLVNVYSEGLASKLSKYYNEEPTSFSYMELKAVAVGLNFVHQYIEQIQNNAIPNKAIDLLHWEKILGITTNNNIPESERRKRVAARYKFASNTLEELISIVKSMVGSGIFDTITCPNDNQYWIKNPSGVVGYDWCSTVFKLIVHLNKRDDYSWKDYIPIVTLIQDTLNLLIPAYSKAIISVGPVFRAGEGQLGFQPLAPDSMENDGHEWSPLALNPTLYYDLDDEEVILNGSKVEQFIDLATFDSSKYATQFNTANQATYNAIDSTFNNKSTASLVGHYPIGAGVSSAITTYYFVAELPSNLTGTYILWDGSDASHRQSIQLVNGKIVLTDGTNTLTSLNRMVASAHVVIAAVVNGATSSLYVSSINAEAWGTLGSSIPASQMLGALYSGGTNPWGNKIACVAQYSGAHSEAVRNNLIQWLGTKYGITISTWNPIQELPLAYYDGDLGITLNGATGVSKWEDQGASNDSARDAVQNTALKQPTYITSDPDFNGHGSVVFNGSTTTLVTGIWNSPKPQPLTYYFVAKYANTVSGSLFDNRPESARITLTMYGATWQFHAGSTVTGYPSAYNSNVVGSITFNGASSKTYVNELLELTIGNMGGNNLTGLTIGSDLNGNTNYPGKIAAIAVYSGVHSDSLRAKIMSFLGAKYNVPVSNWTPLDENPIAYYEANSSGVRLVSSQAAPSNPIAVFDGDLGITLNSGKVSRWADQSGGSFDYGKDAIQNTAINQPSYTLHDSDFNNHGSITFTAGLRLATGVFSETQQPVTVYCVHKLSGVGEDHYLFDRTLDATGQFGMFVGTANTLCLYVPNTQLTGTHPTPSSTSVACGIFNTSASSIYVNNLYTPIASGAVGNLYPLKSITIGACANGLYSANGKIAYLAAYAGVHDEATRGKIMADLSAKYGVAVTLPNVIDRLYDQSYSGDANRIAVQNTLSKMPTYTAIDSDFNGHGSLTFAATKKLTTGVFSSSISQPSTYYIVSRVSGGTSNEFMFDGLDVNQRNIYYVNTSNFPVVYASAVGPTGTSNIRSTKNVSCIVFNGASSALYSNSTSVAFTGNTLTGSPVGLTIGNDYTGTYPWLGKIAFIAVYSGIHNSTMRAKVMQFLGKKFAITIS